MPTTSSQILGLTPKYLYIQTWEIHNTITTAKIIFHNLHKAKINTKTHLPYKWSPTQAWKAPPRELDHEMHQSSIGHAAPAIILDLFNFSQTPQVA